jgi:hypothetical protein
MMTTNKLSAELSPLVNEQLFATYYVARKVNEIIGTLNASMDSAVTYTENVVRSREDENDLLRRSLADMYSELIRLNAEIKDITASSKEAKEIEEMLNGMPESAMIGKIRTTPPLWGALENGKWYYGDTPWAVLRMAKQARVVGEHE